MDIKKIRKAVKIARKNTARERKIMMRVMQCGGTKNNNFAYLRSMWASAYRQEIATRMSL